MPLTCGKKTLLGGLASAVLWSALGIAISQADWLSGARLFWLDQLFAVRQRLGASPAPHRDVVIVGIDERTRAELRKRIGRKVEDRWVFRYAIGRLLVALRRAQVKAVGVDFLLNIPLGGDVDDLVVKGLAGAEKLTTAGTAAVLGCLIPVREAKRPVEAFRRWAAEGNLILQPDRDGKFRRVRPGLVALDGSIPIFAFQVCRVFAGAPDETGSALDTPWRWHDDGSGCLEVEGRFRVPAEMLIDFVGPAQSFEISGRQFSALDVLDGRVPGEKLKGKLVLIGPTLRNADRFSVSVNPTAADRRYREFFERKYGLTLGRAACEGVQVDLLRSGAMSGVEIHANVASQILHGRGLRECSRQMRWLEPALIAAVLLGIGWVFWQAPVVGKRRVLRGMVGGLGLLVVVLCGAIVASVWVFIRYRWVFVPLELTVAWTGQAACGIAVTGVLLRRQNRRIERMFGSAVGDQLLAYINAHPEIMTRNERRVATVLFSDIRGFVSMTERLDPDEVVQLLRRHFEALWQPLARQGAWVDKYAGDLVMAAWNVLRPADDHALQAVRAAVAMKVARARLNEQRLASGREPIDIGIGVHTGELVGGNVGSRKRSNFTLIGDTVNLASRIEHEARNGELLISEDTYKLVEGRVIARALPPVAIRGKTGLYRLYEVFGLADGPVVPGKDKQAGEVMQHGAESRLITT